MTGNHQTLQQTFYALLVLFLLLTGRYAVCNAQETQWKSIPEAAKQALFEAQQEMGNKNYAKAVQILTMFQTKNPKQNHFLVDFNIGTAYALSDNLPEGIRHLEKAAKLEPSYAPVWRNLGKLYYDTKEYLKAGEALERSFRLETNKDPNTLYIAMAAFFQADDMDKTISLGEELLLKIKKINADILGLLVNAYIKKEDFDGSIQTLKKLQQWSPGDPKLWKLRAQCHINKNEYELGAIAYEIYGYLVGLTEEELWTMGDLFAMIGIPIRAAQYYEMALEKDGGSPEEYEKLSTAYYGAYEFDEAIEALDRALGMKSTAERLLLKAQLSYLQDNFGEAQQYYADAAHAFTEDGHEWLMAGYCAMRAGDTATAKKWLLEASKYPEQRNEAQNLIKMISDREKLTNG